MFLLYILQCKFDFCWVCLENWKKHSSATGGYFRCNRFEAVHKADEKQGILISEVSETNLSYFSISDKILSSSFKIQS